MAKIIAEAGTCHADPDPSRRLAKALRYVRAAAGARADFVKFQMFADPIRDDMFCWIEGDEAREPRWRESCMPLEGWRAVQDACAELGVGFLASVFQYTTIHWMQALGASAIKVASRAAKGFPYDQAPGTLLVSQGMYPCPAERPDIVLFECESNYPSTLRWAGNQPGFSDHSGTPWRAIEAIARGCEWVEVHFYDRPEDAGPDLPASLDRAGLALVCQARDAFAEIHSVVDSHRDTVCASSTPPPA